jgi:hypothetical protein
MRSAVLMRAWVYDLGRFFDVSPSDRSFMFAMPDMRSRKVVPSSRDKTLNLEMVSVR